MSGVSACVKALGVSSDEVATGQVKGGVVGVLHNALWGKDIAVPRGSVGKHGSGIAHMQEKRILHGFSVDEAAFITVCALKAVESVKFSHKMGNKLWFERFGVRAVVAEEVESGNPIITGFIFGTEGKNMAVDSEAAQLADHFYALDELSRVREVGATMDRALARFEQIIKENPDEWEDVVSYSVAEVKRMDAEYMAAVERGDMETAQRMVNEYAKVRGYVVDDPERKMMHQAPSFVPGTMEDHERYGHVNGEDLALGSGIVPNDYWTHPQYYQTEAAQRDAFYKVRDVTYRRSQA